MMWEFSREYKFELKASLNALKSAQILRKLQFASEL